MTSVTIPNSVTSIEGGAFYDCYGLTSITIPNSVTSIGDGAFRFCSNIETADISSQAAFNAIAFTDKLTSIILGDDITSIGYEKFSDCYGLTSINVAEDNLNYASIDGVLYSKDKKTLIMCPQGKTGSVTIPNSVTSIGGSAFSGCKGLTSITIPNGVTSIENDTFKGCTGLTSIEIPNSVTSIGDLAFSDCTGLTSVTIPNSVTSIGKYAFHNCAGLTSIEIPNSVTSIKDGTFFGCTGLTNVTIPNSVTSIGYSAFSGCTGLTSVTIGNGVTSIDFYAFEGCTGLTSIIVSCEKYDYFKEKISRYSSIVYGNCTFEIAAKANNEDYGTVTGNGVYNYAKNITLTATPNDHYHFVKWDDGNTQKTRTVHVTQDRTFTAVFAIDEHNVTANANNENYGTVTGEGVYEYGTSITLTATPNDHYHFVKWNDNNTQNPRTVQVTQDSTITAIFAINEHNVTISKNISAAGTVTGNGIYEHNTTVQLTATANEGYRFKGWSDGVTDASREITVTKDTSITANFVALYTIKALASASQGTVSGGGVYEKGETATLVANAKPGYIFAQWADGSDENPRYVTVNRNKTYTAIFRDPDAATAAPEAEESIVEKSEVKKIIDRNGIIYIEKDGTRYFLNGSKAK
ncbi:MAG: leucine-rich repeat protein [Paludibacteraceae bacterium]|nr:leucine-rich repeat protein [Paludibacteraceae bacterium]